MARHRSHQVRWTEGAARDLEAIAEYVANDFGQRAAELRSHLVDAAESLGRHPARGRVVPELHDLGVDLWRELVVGNYRIMYRIQSRRVLVSVVLDGRRDVEHVLLERLIGY
ncbi:MAG: type II toxin-antitoxin system RelE/ParE family toxin [Gemmatimonadaceae bacterium]